MAPSHAARPVRTGERKKVNWVLDADLELRRRIDLAEGLAATSDLFNDLGGRRVPDEWSRVRIPVFDPLLDSCDQVGHAREHTTTQPSVEQLFEPPLH